MEHEKTLHLEGDIRIDHDPQTVEDARLWGFEIAVFDDEVMFDNARTHPSP